MYVTLFNATPVDTEPYRKRLLRYGIELEVINIFEEPEWDGNLLSTAYLKRIAAEHYETRGESTDVIQFLLDDWHRPGSRGVHYGRSFSGYRICIIKERDGWPDTGEHEDLHAAADIIWLYLGIDLSTIFGVEDFDEDVVHGRHPDYTEYDYDKVWAQLKPYLIAAVSKRKRIGYLSAKHRLIVKLREMVALLRNKIESIEEPKETGQPDLTVSPNTSSLYDLAVSYLGTDASPDDLAPDELGCAESLSNIIKAKLPDFPIITGTWTLWDELRKHPQFEEVEEPEPGDIIISPTGEGNGSIPGHAGVFGNYKRIMSNDSKTGQFHNNYDLQAWKVRYQKQGGFPIHIYRLTK